MERRQFLGFLSLGGLVALTGSASAHETGLDDDQFSGAPTWIGTAAARPAPDSHHLNSNGTEFRGRVIYIARDTGAISYIEAGADSWTELPVHLPSYTEASIPPSGAVAGSSFWNSDRKVPAFYDGNDLEYPTIADDVNTATQAVENDSTEVTVWDGTLDADSMQVGRVYRVRLLGNYTTNDSSDTFHLRFYVDGTEVAAIQSIASNVNEAPISATMTMTVRSTGATGTVIPHTEAVFDDQHMDVHHGTETVDTGAANTLSATIQWGVAEAGDRVEIGQAYMEEAN